MSIPHCFINKVVLKSKDSTFESPSNLSQCKNVEFCLHNFPRRTPKFYSGVLRTPGVNPVHPDIHIHLVQTKPGTKLKTTRPRSRYIELGFKVRSLKLRIIMDRIRVEV